MLQAPLSINFSMQAMTDVISLYDNRNKKSGANVADDCLEAFVNVLGNLARDPKAGHKLDSVMAGLLSHSCNNVTIYFIRSITTLKIIKVLKQGKSIEINDLEEARYA